MQVCEYGVRESDVFAPCVTCVLSLEGGEEMQVCE